MADVESPPEWSCNELPKNVWVTVNCPATQTIEGDGVGLSKAQSNILSALVLFCLC